MEMRDTLFLYYHDGFSVDFVPKSVIPRWLTVLMAHKRQ